MGDTKKVVEVVKEIAIKAIEDLVFESLGVGEPDIVRNLERKCQQVLPLVARDFEP